MREFFKPWRRKAGVVTLGVACLFMTRWERSLNRVDCLSFPLIERTRASLMSGNQSVTLGIEFCTNPESVGEFGNVEWDTEGARFTGHGELEFDPFAIQKAQWKWRAAGFGICGFEKKKWRSPNLSQCTVTYVIAPYWSILLLQTALSAYLLLSQPRPTKKSEPSVATGPDHA